MAGSRQSGAWAIKICSSTTLIMSVTTNKTVTKSLKHCVCSWAELGILGQPPCVSSGLCTGRGMFRGAGLGREGGTGLLSTPPVELYQPLSFSEEKPVSSKKQPQNAGFQMCSYGIVYQLGISATDLSAAALWCPGAHSRSPLGRGASTTAEVHKRLLHFTATGCGSARAAQEYWAGS